MADGEGERVAERLGGLGAEQRLGDRVADGDGERVAEWLYGRAAERLGGRAAERAAKRPAGTVEQLPWLSEAVKKRILSLALGEKVSQSTVRGPTRYGTWHCCGAGAASRGAETKLPPRAGAEITNCTSGSSSFQFIKDLKKFYRKNHDC